MRKIWMVLVLSLAGIAAAGEWISMTGKVIGSRPGIDATFYTVRDTATGKVYEANTKRTDVKANEFLFRESLETGCELKMEFNEDTQWPDAIYRIRKIEKVQQLIVG